MVYPSFLNNHTFYALDDSKNNEEQLNAFAQNIKKLHHLTTKNYDSFETLITEYIRFGLDIFQMQTGIVSNITNDKQYIIKDVVTNLDVINPGDVFELEGTYCREVYKSHKTLGFPQVGNLKELQHHPVYENLKLEAYLSAPIFVNTELYGTLNFTSLIPRQNGFSEHEHDLISMMAQSIGNFILLQAREESLKQLNFRMKELVGHVSHDLRNPLGAIKGLVELMIAKEKSPQQVAQYLQVIQEESTRGLELVNTILDEAALGTGKITMQKKAFVLQTMLEKSLNALDTLQKERHLIMNLNIEDESTVYADEKRLKQVIDNLLINSMKYSKESSVITINAIKNAHTMSIEIMNQKSEQNVVTDMNRYKSVGYGMDIVKEVLHMHNTALRVDEDATLFKVSFELALQPDTEAIE